MLFVDRQGIARVQLEREALRVIAESCLKSPNLETGGILIGRYVDDNSLVVVEHATPPPRDSLRTATTFERGTRGLKKRLRADWKRGLYYVGEWHAHTGAAPMPSGRDLASLMCIAANSKMHCMNPVLLVVGAGGRFYAATCRAGTLRERPEGDGQ